MHDLQRRIGAPLAIDQGEPAQRNPGGAANRPQENLPADEGAARDEAKGVEFRRLGQFAYLTFDVQPRIVPDQRDVGRLGAPAQGHDRRRVTLNAAIGALEHLDE